MDAHGIVAAQVFTSEARIPIENAVVLITKKLPGSGRQLLAFRLTDAEGFTAPAAVETPPDGEAPFVTVDLLAEKPGYDRILVEDAQVFPGVETLQEFMLVPTPELPDAYDRTEVIRVSAQPL
jgi:hypothetical protein